MLVLSRTDAETLGSYHKVNSYYDYYILHNFYIYILRLLHKLPHLPALRGESGNLMKL